MEENNLDNIPDEIFELLVEKSFEELTTLETKTVLDYLTEEEYTDSRNLILEFKETNENLSFAVEEKTIQKYSSKKRGFDYRQIAAVLLVLITFGLGVVFFQKKGNKRPEQLVEKEVKKEIEPSVLLPVPKLVIVDSIDSISVKREMNNIKQVVAKIQEEKGVSLADDDYPEQLIITI